MRDPRKASDIGKEIRGKGKEKSTASFKEGPRGLSLSKADLEKKGEGRGNGTQ